VGDLKLWVGAGADRVATAEALGKLLAPYGDIPAEVLAQLEEDYELRTVPTPLQRLLSK
jgi:hypothetical protein